VTTSADRQEQIRRAAATVIARNGFHASTVDLIASQAGVAVGTIYNYFADKTDILRQIFATEQTRRRVMFATISALDLPAVDKILRGIGEHLASIAEDDSAARILLQESAMPQITGLTPPVRGGALAEFIGLTAAQGVAEGQVACDPPALAVVLTGAVMGLVEAHIRSTPGRDQAEIGASDGSCLPPALATGLVEIERLLRHGCCRTQAHQEQEESR
jgi:AcrR family transcriptional regulator